MTNITVQTRIINFIVLNENEPLKISFGGNKISFSIANKNITFITDQGIVNYTAGEDLGGHRIVYVNEENKAVYASNQDFSQLFKILGITKGACENNAEANIQTFGVMEELSWNWDISKPIYLSINGLLTQVLPDSGFILQVAFPINSTKIFIEKKQPIIIS